MRGLLTDTSQLTTSNGIAVALMSTADGAPSALFEAEHEGIKKACDKRVKEFCAGRMAAREALASLGVAACAIPVDESRAPIWPKICTGSISHTRYMAIALAALQKDYCALGVDLERLGRVCKLDYKKMILTSPEVGAMASSSLGEDVYSTLLFSAKEAFYKAQYTLYKQWLNFSDVEIHLDEKQSSFTMSCEQVNFEKHPVFGQYWLFEDCLVSLVAVYALS